MSMTSSQFSYAALLPAGLPAPAVRWTGLAKYSFVGGNNDPDGVPVDGLVDAVTAVLKREGKSLARSSSAMPTSPARLMIS
jgi:2-aminoadipate transaminase